MIGQEKQDADDQAKLDARKQATAKSKESVIAQLRLLADMYSLKFNPAKAEALFDGLLRLDSTDLSILQDAADFYRENHRYDKALRVLPLIIAHPQAEDWQKANAHDDIGEMHTATGQLEPAMRAYLAISTSIRRSAASRPQSLLLQRKPGHFLRKPRLDAQLAGGFGQGLDFF